MAVVTRRIGLSLGADLCWPAAYESLMRRLDLTIPDGGDQVRFSVDRVRTQPFDLEGPTPYHMVIDRLTHWFMHRREWVKKAALDGTYVLNNPWAIQACEKHTTYVAMLKLGFPIPKTYMVPAKAYDTSEHPDMAVAVDRYNDLFDLDAVGDAVGYPAFLKPYDGGGWVGVTRVKNSRELHQAYDASGKRIQHLQAAVKDWDLFVRGLGIGPQVNVIRYDPDQPLHGRYVVDFNYLDAAAWQRAQRMTRVINAFFGWDYNSCEMLRAESVLHPIDFANACPDSQVTSLHFHFPWLVKSLLRWSVFCTATRRPVSLQTDWRPYLQIAEEGGTFDEKLERYDALARAWFQEEQFEEFCSRYLGDLDAIAYEYFGTDEFREAVRAKVAALYPKHEIEPFTDHFFGLVQFWRKTEADRVGGGAR